MFNISHGTEWLSEDTITSYSFGVFGSAAIYKEVAKFAETKIIKGKPVNVIRFKRVSDISATHILFVPFDDNYYIEQIFGRIKGKNILLFTEQAPIKKYTVINFLSEKEKKKSFEINTKNIAEQELIISKTLLKIGGTEKDLRNLYTQTEKKLLEKQKKLETQKLKLDKLEVNLKAKEKKISQQQLEIDAKQGLVDVKESELVIQQASIDSMKVELQNEREKLEKSREILADKENEIDSQKAALAEEVRQKEAIKKSNELASDELREKQEKIKEIDARLDESNDTVETQKWAIYVFLGFIAIILVLIVFSIRANKKKKEANELLTKQKDVLHKQKEEIEAQTKQLESANTELEKLSIVASKTDNAVTIMDAEGNFEWINAGYTRLFGYTLQLLTHELDENIKNISGNEKIKALIEKCIEDKQTVFYENKTLTRAGKAVWAQTTLTPILDEEENVVKLVSIDTDISKQKDAEKEIRQQSEELVAQKDELLVKNEEIEEAHGSIQSSIKYAKSIQNSILPIHANMDKFFNSFVLFMPKDIVSGDFYWFAHLPAKAGYTEKVFLAAIDCTGHGVPGAFMSLIGNRLLNEIVVEKKIVAPRLILEELHKGVIKALKQDVRDNNDGMDVCLIRLEYCKDGIQRLKFAGAKRPLFYHKKGEQEVKMLNGDRKSIGGTQKKRTNVQFTDQEIELVPGDKAWLSTDGLIDQNNSTRKRYGTPRFTQLLNKLVKEDLLTQETGILTSLIQYQGAEEQRDDITVIGIEIINH